MSTRSETMHARRGDTYASSARSPEKYSTVSSWGSILRRECPRSHIHQDSRLPVAQLVDRDSRWGRSPPRKSDNRRRSSVLDLGQDQGHRGHGCVVRFPYPHRLYPPCRLAQTYSNVPRGHGGIEHPRSESLDADRIRRTMQRMNRFLDARDPRDLTPNRAHPHLVMLRLVTLNVR